MNHLTFHDKFSPQDFEEQYNLRLSRPDYEETVLADWVARSELARNKMTCSLDIRYGEGERQKLDIYSCGDSTAPTMLYFHGGYWQRGDKSIYSFLAMPFVDAGINVVVAGYDLCPTVTLTQISQQAREAVAAVYRRANEFGISHQRISVVGHSAGGHITQMMMGTDWSNYGGDLPKRLISAGIPISPLSLLEPVRLTVGLNTGIRMDAAEAELQSPMLHHPPVTDAPQLVAVGATETGEFHRQAQMYVEAFGSKERLIELYVVPGVDHFDELNVLADPQTAFFRKTLAITSQ